MRRTRGHGQAGSATSARAPRVPRAAALTGALAAALLALAAPIATPLAAQAAPASAAPVDEATPAPPAHLPFFAGERLEYQVRVARFGSVGRVAMTVAGPDTVRGVETLVLRFDLRAGFGLLKAEDHTASWLEAGPAPARLRSWRYEKRERRPGARRDELVEFAPDARRWTRAAHGGDLAAARGTSPSDAPLDELSFLYFLRTLPLARPEASWALDRHYDPARTPTRVRLLGRRTVTTPAGTFQTVGIEMRVRDAARYASGEGTIVVDVSDDACRLPVRIESDVPVFGRAVLLLERNNHPTAHHLAVSR